MASEGPSVATRTLALKLHECSGETPFGREIDPVQGGRGCARLLHFSLRMNLPKLPHQKVYFEDRPFSNGMLARCFRTLAESHDQREGFVIVTTDESSYYGVL